MKNFILLISVLLCVSCQTSITEKQKKYIDELDIYEFYEYYYSSTTRLALSKHLVGENFINYVEAIEYYEKSNLHDDDTVLSKALFDSSMELYRKAYANDGISNAIGNSITHKLSKGIKGVETEVIDELLMLEERKFKSSDHNAVYKLWSDEKILFTIGLCYIKQYNVELAMKYQNKLEKIVENDDLSRQIGNLYLKSIIEIISNKENSCEGLNDIIKEIDKDKATKDRLNLQYNTYETDRFQRKYKQIISLYNNLCL